ncbi:hypothetical protein SFC07_11125 [Corynebacterium callunae]|uniref:hypothetical protein n=1 Tax=Corynebacterium callunae TaxID=1721 RepID=UPI003982AD60
MSDQAFCKMCSQPIRFEFTRSGKQIALDYSSDQDHGTFVLNVERSPQGEYRRIAIALSKAERVQAVEEGELLFLAHRLSCANEREGTPIPPDLREKAQSVISDAKGFWNGNR